MLWYHLVRRSSYCDEQVAIDSPGSLLGCGERAPAAPPQGKAGENGQPGGCLCKSSLQETVGYAGGKLPAGVANDWVTRRSPSPACADSRVSLNVFLPCSFGDLLVRATYVASQSQDGGSMYSLACRTRGIIPLDYCSLCDHSD